MSVPTVRETNCPLSIVALEGETLVAVSAVFTVMALFAVAVLLALSVTLTQYVVVEAGLGE